jgi:hypothetical protein
MKKTSRLVTISKGLDGTNTSMGVEQTRTTLTLFLTSRETAAERHCNIRNTDVARSGRIVDSESIVDYVVSDRYL